MQAAAKSKSRYEIREKLGAGGMGVVYRAYDKVLKADVALKTLLDISDPVALSLFRAECDKLAQIVHPNIIEIRDIGELEEGGAKKPFLVMPLLRGSTLAQLVSAPGQVLTLERFVDIITQTCRGLQSAHEHGLIHRDLKPSNIFVLDDDSVKIIDFGVAHRLEDSRTVGQKGTLLYMSPEQIQMKPLSAASDIFSLGVVCYEVLTRRRPFERPTEAEVVDAILNYVPAPVSEINQNVTYAISQVIHKAMAKQAWHRFATAKEFGETMRKALQNEPIAMFNAARLRPRLERANNAFNGGDYQFATEIVAELEAEGHLDPAISELRQQIDHAMRQKRISQLLESARSRMEAGEYPLALQKLQEVLEIEPRHTDALALKSRVESRRAEEDIGDWLRLARQHVTNFAFGHARQALQRILDLRPKEPRAIQLQSEVDRLEQEYTRVRQEKERLYQAALEAQRSRDISSALSNLERVLELDRRAPEILDPSRGATYQGLYNQLRSEYEAIQNAYAEARNHLENRNFAAALQICNEQLQRYPGYPLFQALKFDVEEQHRLALSARIAEVDRQVEAEADLDRRVLILQEALRDYPGERHFERALQLTRDKRDLVESIVARARAHEEAGQFAEALTQWQTLKTIHSRYPGLHLEIERLQKRREAHERVVRKRRLIEQIDDCMEAGNHAAALELIKNAQEEFPSDSELAQLEKLANQELERAAQALRLLLEGQTACAGGRFEEGLRLLRQAHELDQANPAIRTALLDTLIEQARQQMEQDARSADLLLEQALALEPGHALAKGLLNLLQERRQREFAERCVSRAREFEANGDLRSALQVIEQGLASYPDDPQMAPRQVALRKKLAEERRRDLEQVRRIEQEAKAIVDPPTLTEYSKRIDRIAGRYDEDNEFWGAANRVRERLQALAPSATEIAGQQAGAVDARMLGPEQPAISQTRKPGAGQTFVETLRNAPAVSWRVVRRIHTQVPLQWMLAVAAVLLILAGVTLKVVTRRPPPPVSVPKRPTPEFTTAPPSASVPPEPQLLRILSTSGKVTVNDAAAEPIQEGQFIREFAPGEYTVKITMARGMEASLHFQVSPTGPALITQPLETKQVFALVLSSCGGQSRLYASSSGSVKVDGQSAGQLSPDGLALPELAPGNHQLELGEGKDLRKKTVAVAGRAVTVLLDADPNTGNLLVRTNEDGVTVEILLNGKSVRSGVTQNHQMPFRGLAAGVYTVQASKQGFHPVREERVEIRKGPNAPLSFTMTAIPVVASVMVRGVPGAELSLDGRPIGTVASDGTFPVSNIPPGRHVLEARKEGFITWRDTVNLVAGNNELIEINLQPAPSRNKEVEPTLPPRKPLPPPPPPSAMSFWPPDAWTEQNGWYVRNVGGFLKYGLLPTRGTLTFSVRWSKSGWFTRGSVEWFLNYLDDKNYLLFSIDGSGFESFRVEGGRKIPQGKKVPLKKQNVYTIRIDVQPGRVIHSVLLDGKWKFLEPWNQAGLDFTQGNFGFHIAKNNSLWLKDFGFERVP